jgi:hypothetical protein
MRLPWIRTRSLRCTSRRFRLLQIGADLILHPVGRPPEPHAQVPSQPAQQTDDDRPIHPKSQSFPAHLLTYAVSRCAQIGAHHAVAHIRERLPELAQSVRPAGGGVRPEQTLAIGQQLLVKLIEFRVGVRQPLDDVLLRLDHLGHRRFQVGAMGGRKFDNQRVELLAL